MSLSEDWVWNHTTLWSPAFFFPVKIKSARESFFWPFFDFFHGWKMAFTHTFFEFFTGGRKFSRTLVRIFSRVGFFFFTGRKREGNEKLSIIFTQGFFFSRVQKKVKFIKFHGKSKLYFSRTLVSIFTYVIWKKFSRTQLTFHGQFSRFFHGRKKKFTYGNPKIVENFHGRDFDFHGKKKTLLLCDHCDH